MSEHQFVVTDIDFQTFKENSGGTRHVPIKEEIVKDEDILLFTQAEMDEFSSNPNNFEIVENMVATENVGENTTFNVQFTEDQMNQLFTPENFPKLPLDIGSIYKSENMKTERQFSHFIKYKVQDGKHTKVWQCGICSKEFGHQYILMRHLPTHTDERKFQCNTCGKAFRQMSTLSQHRAIHSAERPYVCEVCQKNFNRVSTLISHRKTHTGHKPHRCHLCNKAFHQKGNLRNHIFTHTNERPYKCDVCSKGFNQMSNLMCHKLKAHQRSDKPRYSCQTCGKEFQKRMGLRNHEQYEHGDLSETGIVNGSPRIRYTNGVLVDPINTAAMQHAIATNQIPFALLRPLNGIPVLVRILAAGEKQMLVPATADDLKRHGQITITPKTEEKLQLEDEESVKTTNKDEICVNNVEPDKPAGSTVQIRIPVVATVIQRCGKDGNMCMDVESPGPSDGGMLNDNYVFTTTNDSIQNQQVCIDSGKELKVDISNFDGRHAVKEDIQFFDLSTGENDAKDKFFTFHSTTNGLSGLMNSNVINLPHNVENVQDLHVYSEDILDIEGGPEDDRIFQFSKIGSDSGRTLIIPPVPQLLGKPQTISISEADTILDTNNVLLEATNITEENFTII